MSLVPGILALTLCATNAAAQTRVRVTRDQSTIWQAGFISVATVVEQGTVLEVVSRQGNWYEVVLPSNNRTEPATGFIGVNVVESMDGPPLGAARGPDLSRAQPRTGSRPSPLSNPGSKGVRVFANAGYGRFTAHQSFKAVLDQSGGLWYGGGGEFHGGPWFFAGAADWFRQAGERAFVFNGSVFKLGIPETITIIPVMATVGYRRPYTAAISVSAGGGAGRYIYKEESTVAGSSEVFKLQATSYHAVGALEWHSRGLLATAVEFQYTWVPNALTGGVATSVDEHDLGGMQVRLKILLGR